MSFDRLYPDDSINSVTEGFPPFLQNAVFRWIKFHVQNHTPESAVSNYLHTTIDDMFNAKISSVLRRNLGDTLEEHLRSISIDPRLTAEYINYLLQAYPDARSAQELRGILNEANSEYTVHFRTSTQASNSQGLPDPEWHTVSASLQFRVSEEAEAQIAKLKDYERMQQAWNDLYDTSQRNLPSVVQKSMDELAGAIRDRLYPDDKKTNLSDYVSRIERDIDTLDLPKKDKIDWPVLVKSVAGFVNSRSMHNTGTDSDPDYADAHTVLHLCIASIIILRNREQ